VTPKPAERQAARLLHWYPRSWRHRYGEEFTELLIADITERPRCRSRTLDVARGALVARLASAGLGGCAHEPADQIRASLTSLTLCLAVFLALGTAMWSQLTIGWQWSAPDTPATGVAMVLMSAAMFAFVLLAAAAVVPVAWHAAVHLDGDPAAGRRSRRLLCPALLALGGATILFLGARHLGNGWPGTGGHRWHGQGLVPGGIGAFSWASTLSVSSFWAHPAALARLPAGELAWMALSPVAVAATAAGAATLVRRTPLSSRVLRYEAVLGSVTCAVMVVFLAGCLAWIVDGGAGPANLFHAGAIDVAATVLLTTALAVGQRAAREARRGSLMHPGGG
jgi:hypothetical protein